MALTSWLDLVFPRVCLVCRSKLTNETALCAKCAAELQPHTSLFCGTCRARLPTFKKICHEDTPYLLGAAGDYHNVILRTLLHALKFENIKDAAGPLSQFLLIYLRALSLDLKDWLVLPIPLHPARERARGFNQALLLAKNVAENLELPILDKTLERAKHTRPQIELHDHALRQANLENAFRVEDADPIRARNILLVDDITTSGATLRTAARTLRQAGARKIIALAVTKA